jgi:hypothetical protein
MSAKRLALDVNRVHKALDLDLTLEERPRTAKTLNIEQDSLVEDTDKLEVEKTSLTSDNHEHMSSVVSDYQSDLDELERSIAEFRDYLNKLREKEEE